MDVDRWQRVEQVLDRALAADPSHWPAMLDDCCRGDPELRAEVETLLARVATAERFLASPPAAAASALIEHATAQNAAVTVEGRRLESREIVRRIGRDGVSRADRERADGGEGGRGEPN